MLRKLFAAALAALLAAPAALMGQTNPLDAHSFPMLYNYDLDSTTYVGCEFQGQGATLGGADFLVVSAPLDAVAASTTITGTNSFDAVSVGDLLKFAPAGPQGTYQERYVTARASGSSITVNSAITLPAGVRFAFRKRACGAALGWVPTRGFTRIMFQFQIRQIVTTTGIDYRIEGKLDGVGQNSVVLSADPITKTSTYDGWEDVTYRADYVRIVFKLNTTDDGDDLTTNAEQLDVVTHLVK